MKLFSTALLFLALLINSAISYADKYPDEGSACYKKCLRERNICRDNCKRQKTKNRTEKHACLDACDPPFNNHCVIHCPMKSD